MIDPGNAPGAHIKRSQALKGRNPLRTLPSPHKPSAGSEPLSPSQLSGRTECARPALRTEPPTLPFAPSHLHASPHLPPLLRLPIRTFHLGDPNRILRIPASPPTLLSNLMLTMLSPVRDIGFTPPVGHRNPEPVRTPHRVHSEIARHSARQFHHPARRVAISIVSIRPNGGENHSVIRNLSSLRISGHCANLRSEGSTAQDSDSKKEAAQRLPRMTCSASSLSIFCRSSPHG